MRMIIIVVFLLLLCECAREVKTASKFELSPVDNRNRWMSLAYFVEKYYDTTGWTTEEIATELSLAEYLMNKERDGS